MRDDTRTTLTLEVARFVFRNLLFGVPVTCSSHEDCSVNNKTTEVFKSLLEAGNSRIRRPDIWTQILGEVLGREFRGGLGAGERRINVESTVCVE